MKRSNKLKQLKLKLKSENKKLTDFEKNKFDENGKLNFDVVIDIQKLQTDIYYIEKQIGFLKKGKSHLGNSFYDTNINKYI